MRLFFENGGSDALVVRVGASRGGAITDNAISAPRLEAAKRGLWALDKAKGVRVRPEHVHEALRELAGIAEHPASKKFPLGVPEKERLKGFWG